MIRRGKDLLTLTPEYRSRWVCFPCRKMFRKDPGAAAVVCPQCRRPMIDMGCYFETPAQSDRKMWSLLQRLAEAGYRFRTEENRATFYAPDATGARTPSARTVMLRMRAWLSKGGK